MNDFLTLALALLAGVLLGAIFFGGLWWTVRKGVSSKHSAPWFLGSSAVADGCYSRWILFISGGHWDRLLACLFRIHHRAFHRQALNRPTS